MLLSESVAAAATIRLPHQSFSFVGESAVVLSFLLVCAVLGSLAAGVLLGYGVCVAMFGMFRLHARQVRGGGRVAAQTVLEG